MDALQGAKQYLAQFEEYRQERQRNPDRLDISETSYPAVATAYAMVAQAEAATRQAVALERIASAVQGDGLTLIDGLYAIVEAMTRGTVS